MFTGIISKTSKIKDVNKTKGGFSIEVVNNLGKVKLGESISINGVCSTVKKTVRLSSKRASARQSKTISFEYMPETLKLSNVGFLKKGDTVNTEQSMRLSDGLHGHMVLGHIDDKGEILSLKKEGNSRVFEIKVPQKTFMKLLVHKGSVAVEGISLTVAEVLKDSFVVKIIPYTLKHTNLRFKKKGDLVNLEFDILAKYASRTKFT